MQHPFQCIGTIRKPLPLQGCGLFLVACGPKLILVHADTGKNLWAWTAGISGNALLEAEDFGENDGRPAKRQKQAPGPAKSPNIVKLSVSPNCQNAVVVTEDKCIHVLLIQPNGELYDVSPKSSRFMPKRPCAVQILPDNATILCGDKFGDVYSLPLYEQELPSNDDHLPTSNQEEAIRESPKAFKSSATLLTVHTQRNRKALESQLKQKNLTPKTKEPLKTEHELLLGHISMLTDLAFANREVDGQSRTYIITADRDEHIRVSRGRPQSHVIEGYCLGHKEFVSKVCLLPGTDLLVSGGGDDWIGIWDWPAFKLRKKFKEFGSVMCSDGQPIALFGIWIVPAAIGHSMIDVVVFACEKIPRLCYVPISELQKEGTEVQEFKVERFDAAILDMAVAGSDIVLSFDAQENSQPRLQAYRLHGATWDDLTTVPDYEMNTKLEEVNNFSQKVPDTKILDDLLYGVEKLRKRGSQDDVEDE